ncbi:DUF5691 domain-containing protein [Micromonospora sp. NPDC049559]|uniref:SWIM zinc finger family protein n=1 Tax=Micromonospora sp. NPDC049559 TaxID=3155923 RepID=UPI00341B0C4C
MPIERWNTEQVLALAPDAGSAKGARGVSAATSWSATGIDEDLLWGLCKGSGQHPYRACVDLTGPAYHCSCPSRKFPCKHALGLLLRWSSGEVEVATAPDWAAEWRRARAARAARSVARRAGSAPVDEAAARRRAGQRADRVGAGLAELDRWLLDQVEQGLGEAERAGRAPFETMAARMVDAQAPGVAGTLRRLGDLAGVGSNWADRLLGELALLRLLVAGYSRLGELPEPLAATVRARIGLPVPTEEVLATPPLRDRWQVLGRYDVVDERLTTRRTWLRGATTGRAALLLSYAVPGQAFPADAPPGTVLDADLCWYPGSYPLRALVARRHGPAEPLVAPAGAAPVRDALAAWSAALAADPWCDSLALLLADALPTMDGHLVDRAGDALPLAPGHDEPWWLIAAAGGNPVTVAAEYGPAGLRPLAAWPDGRYVPAPAGSTGARRHPSELPPELLSAALVGTGRRPFAAATIGVGGRGLHLPAGDGAAALLTAVAVAVTYHRAGVLPVTGREPVGPAPEESAPPVPEPAARRLRLLLRDGGVPGGAETAQLLLGEWLRLVADRGHRVPAEALPALLEAGRRRTALRPALASAAGRRGGWLAGLHPDWRYLLGEETADPRPDDWTTGTPGARLAHLLAVRRADPAAGRELLAASYDDEAPAERARFVEALGTGLSLADEPLLERALDDRRKEVRLAAARQLAALPGSALGARMAERARRCVRLERPAPTESGPATTGDGPAGPGGGDAPADRELIVVTPPAEYDPFLLRDGVPPTPPRGVGAGAWLLEEIVARTPLDTWSRLLGRPAAAVLALDVADDWATVLHRGMARAAVAQRDPEWVTALADLWSRPVNRDLDPADERLAAQLHEALSPVELARYTARSLRRDPARAVRLLELNPGPWPAELGAAVLAAISALAEDRYAWQFNEVCRLAAAALPVGAAEEVAELARRLETRNSTNRQTATVARLAATLTFRHQMHEELR